MFPNLPFVPVYLIRGSPQSHHSFPHLHSESPLLWMSVAYRNNGKGNYGPVCWEFEGFNNHAVIYCSDEGCNYSPVACVFMLARSFRELCPFPRVPDDN